MTNPDPTDVVDEPPQALDHDADLETEEAYLDDLYMALGGQGGADNFRAVIDDRLGKIEEVYAKRIEEIRDEELADIHLVSAAQFFASEEAKAEVQERKGLFARARSAITRSGRADNRSDKERYEAQLEWQKLRQDVALDIERDLAAARYDLQSATSEEERHRAGVMMSLLALAERFFAAGEYQKGFDLYEDARAIRMVETHAAHIAGREAEPLPDDAFHEDTQTRDPDARDDDHVSLAPLVQELIHNKASLTNDIARLEALFAKTLQDDASEHADLAQAKRFLDDVDLTQFDPLPDPPQQDDRARAAYDLDQLNNIQRILDRFAGIGTDTATEAAAAAREKLGVLISFSGGSVKRAGADLDGVGEIVLKSKANDVPQSVVRPIVAQLDTIALLAETGDLTADQIDMITDLSNALEDSVDYAVQHKDTYNKCAKLIAEIEKECERDRFNYNVAARTGLRDRLRELEGPDYQRDADRLLTQLTALKSAMTTASNEAKDNKTKFGELFKLMESNRARVLKAYKPVLADICELPASEDSDQADLKSKLKVFKKELETEGHYASHFDAIWGRIDQGNRDTYDAVETKLTDKTVEWLADIQRLKVSVARAKDMFASQSSHYDSLDMFLRGASEHNQDRQLLNAAVGDITKADAEIRLRKSNEETFKTKRKALLNFISKEKGNIAKDAREAFENYEHILSALKSRADNATNSAEWADIVTEIKGYEVTIHKFAKRNQSQNEAKTLAGKLAKAARSMRICHNDIFAFGQSVRVLGGSIIGEGKDAARMAAQDGDTVADAVFSLLDQREDVLIDFMQLIRRVTEGDELHTLAGLLERSATDDEMMALREQALAQLLRRRRFLEENKAALTYRGNPYDYGAEADALIIALSLTENDLLTLIKRGERG